VDAAKLVYKGSSGGGPIPDVQFTPSDACVNPISWEGYCNTSAYPNASSCDGTSCNGDDNYLYTNDAGVLFTATWTARNLDPTVHYDVYTRWVSSSNRSSSVRYTVDHDSGPTTVYEDQRSNGQQWILLTSDVTFASGIGVVTLNHTPSAAGSDRASADAVAFLPHINVGQVDIANSHYFVQNSFGTFLVNIANNDIFYYQFNDSDADDIVDDNELSDLTPAQAAMFGIVTGRTYAAERQNFANWYSFYRRREFTAKSAIAQVIDTMSGVYIGIVTIHERIKQRGLPVNVEIDGTNYDDANSLLNTLYGMYSSGGTPLRLGVKNIGEYYKGNYIKPSSLPLGTSNSSYPFFTADRGGTCQQAFMIAMTDGYYNGSSPSVGNADTDNNTDFDGGKFADKDANIANTLADTTMKYYEADLNTSLDNNVPINARDTATFQHMVSYTLSFGLKGTIDPALWLDCPLGNCPAWPDPDPNSSSAIPEKIDDMYHAAINGRGKYISAGNPEQLIQALMDLKSDIESRIGAAAALATNSIQRQVGTRIFQGIYHTDNWYGDVLSKRIEAVSGDVGDAIWSARQKLDSVTWDNRKIFTTDGYSGIAFQYQNLTIAQKAALDPDTQRAAAMLRYLRGETTNDTNHGGTFRATNGKLGDIVHSAPLFYDDVIYIGANDGMLHAFDAENGTELFSYVPNLIFSDLKYLADPGYSHRFYVDSTPYVQNIGTVEAPEVLLIEGLRKGGKGYFCLDVTTPHPESEITADV